MALILALKNRNSVVVASDSPNLTDGSLQFGQFMNVPGRAFLLVAGNLTAVQRPIMETVLPKLTIRTSAAELAQVVQAALVLQTLPHLPPNNGRVELIIAGIDPVRHIEEPGLYYMDSAQSFSLQSVSQNAAAAGSTGAVAEVLGGRNLAAATTDELVTAAKECLATTKLRWPTDLAAHQCFGIITPDQIRVLEF